MKRHLNVLTRLQGAGVLPFADELLPLAERATYEALEALSPTRCAGCERSGALICRIVWHRSRSSIRVIVASDAAPRLGICCVPSARSRARLRQWPRRSIAAWRVPSMHIRCRASSRRTRMRASAVWHRIWRSCSTTLPCMPRWQHPMLRRCVVRCGRGGVCARDCGGVSAAWIRPYGSNRALVLRSFGCPVAGRLVKYGHGDQRELGRDERREHARGMYETVEDVRGRRLLLIDDVITRARPWQQPRRSSSVPAPQQSMASLSHAFGRGWFCGSEDSAAHRADKRATGGLRSPDRCLGAAHDARRAPTNGLHQLERPRSR